MQPIWLLDIDGVINADPGQYHLWPQDQWIHTTALDANDKKWRIVTAKPVIDFINLIHHSGAAEIVWLTTWQNDANNVSDALGLPHLRVLENPMLIGTRYHGHNWWKLAEATKVGADGRPMIWTDDDLSREIRELFGTEQPTDSLLIAPKGSEGLAPVHLERIAAFLGM